MLPRIGSQLQRFIQARESFGCAAGREIQKPEIGVQPRISGSDRERLLVPGDVLSQQGRSFLSFEDRLVLPIASDNLDPYVAHLGGARLSKGDAPGRRVRIADVVG